MASSFPAAPLSSLYETNSEINCEKACNIHHATLYLQKTASSVAMHQQTPMSSYGCSNHDLESGYLESKKYNKKRFPIFILIISMLEICVFVYDILTMQQQQQYSNIIPSSALASASGADFAMAIPTDSVFIYRPDRRLEVWRFISYMFLHANWFHLGFNVIVQLLYGIPLEVMHGSVRIAVIYFAGVFAGSLGTSVVDSEVYLVGASGGVYAFLAAHLANITLNYGQMKYAMVQLSSVLIFVICDLGFAFYTRYIAAADTLRSNIPPVSYIAHITGALAGLTMGFLVLKNFEHRAYENLLWWLALGIYCAFTLFAIIFNLINTVTAQRMEEQSEVIAQHLLHDLGVS